jgi:predicted ABC-type ATPase
VANRSYLFDNSGDSAELIAEVTDGSIIQVKTDLVPQWFVRNVLDKAT